MNRFSVRVLLLIFPSLFGYPVWAQDSAPRVEVAKARNTSSARIAPISKQQLFGSIPVSTRSQEARKFVELSLDKYENHIVDGALSNARRAIQKDPQFALGYAALALASLGSIPDSAALGRAKSLVPRATPDEQLLIRWMTSISDRDLLPAISAMNDLLQRYPNNKHVLYILADWLYSQQDYDRSRQMLETVHQLDPDFPPALNLLGYAYIQTGTPDPTKAIASLQRYAEVLPNSPNPQDSLGEVLRLSGDDQGSLDHYSAALQIDPTYISSRYGLGDTSTLMGNYLRARAEYDEAIAVANNSRDRSHSEFQKALIYFWEGQPAEGRKALDALNEKAQQLKEPYSQFELGFGRAMLAADPSVELAQLRWLETWLQDPVDGLTEVDRDSSLAQVLRERTRISARRGELALAEASVRRLEHLADLSRDLLVVNSYESARGYLLAAKGDLAGAVDELAADPRSLLALAQLATAQERLGNTSAAEATRTRIKYLRAPTVEWYLLTTTLATH
jgi:tetratricopeptide (TPR) repeat protein